MWPTKLLERGHEVRKGVAAHRQLVEGRLRFKGPVPCVSERLHLGGAVLQALLEENVERPLGVERRVEVDQVDALVRDLLAQDREVVAEEYRAVGDVGVRQAGLFLFCHGENIRRGSDGKISVRSPCQHPDAILHFLKMMLTLTMETLNQ